MAFTIYEFLGPSGRIAQGVYTPYPSVIPGVAPFENDDREFYALYQGGPTIDYTTVSQSRTQALGARIASKCEAACLDIEEVFTIAPQSGSRDLKTEAYVTTPTPGTTTDQEALDDMTNCLFPAATYMRQGGYRGLLGNYNLVPTNTAYSAGLGANSIYTVARYAPTYDASLAAWRTRNSLLIANGYLNYYNCFMPSIYPSYAPGGGWTEQDELNALKRTATLFYNECRRLSASTPILFFVRPSQGTNGSNWAYLYPATFMESLIRHVRDLGAEGVICWEGYGTWAELVAAGHPQTLAMLSREFSQRSSARRRQRRQAHSEL